MSTSPVLPGTNPEVDSETERIIHGMIERILKTHRYRVTDFGFCAALFFTRTHARLYRPELAEVLQNAPPGDSQLQRHLAKIEADIDRRIREARRAA